MSPDGFLKTDAPLQHRWHDVAAPIPHLELLLQAVGGMTEHWLRFISAIKFPASFRPHVLAVNNLDHGLGPADRNLRSRVPPDCGMRRRAVLFMSNRHLVEVRSVRNYTPADVARYSCSKKRYVDRQYNQTSSIA
jgi:hypothetical protein